MFIQPEQSKQAEQILSATNQLIKHQKEKEVLLGEKFNVFSILKMEKKENATHSAFLCELLNPVGTHLKGRTFLRIFLDVLRIETIDLDSANSKTEHYIGKVDYEKETGGRIDIYIWDKQGNCISIENKIDASDQYAQIKRYCNYHKEKNTVFYLTKEGVLPDESSRGELLEGKDYFVISYKNDIIKWLELCMKETFDSPILRETIKQYIILLKKITHNMNNEEEELYDLILKNQDGASIISANYSKAIQFVYNKLREDVFNQLKVKISDRYNLYLGSKVESTFSQIWIKIKGKNETSLFFGIQGFSLDNGLRIGIFVNNGQYKPEYVKLGQKWSNCWIEFIDFDDFEGFSADITKSRTIYKLYSDPDFQTGFVNHIVNNTIEYIEENYSSVNPLLSEV